MPREENDMCRRQYCCPHSKMGCNDDTDDGENNGIANHYFQTTTTILDAILVDDDENNDNADHSCCILHFVLVTNDLRSKVRSKN